MSTRTTWSSAAASPAECVTHSKTDCLEEWSYYEPDTSPGNGSVQDELDKAPGPESPLVIAEYHTNIILCCSVAVQDEMCQGEIHREKHLGCILEKAGGLTG